VKFFKELKTMGVVGKWIKGVLVGTKKSGYTPVANSETGEVRKLRNPSQKGGKYAEEIKTRVNVDTGGFVTEKGRIWRSGYLSALRDKADAFLSKSDPAKLKESRQKSAEKRLAKIRIDKKK
jgi:hypothetical protein